MKRKTRYLIAAIPAAFLPLMYIWMVFNVLLSIVSGADVTLEKETIFWYCGYAAIYATLIQWPFYFIWVGCSKELTSRQKIVWWIAILLGNMFTMPYFLWCKFKRNTINGLMTMTKNQKIRKYILKK